MITYRWIGPIAPTIAIPNANAFAPLLDAKADHSYTVDLRLADADQMTSINTQYRSVTKPTDVLSFPLYSSLAQLPDHDAPIGDIIICPVMIDPANLNEAEIIIHGTLHLLGYDHETDQKIWDTARQQVSLDHDSTSA